MSLNLEYDAHPYITHLFLSAIIARLSDSYIIDKLLQYIPSATIPNIYRQNHAQMVTFVGDLSRYIIFNGTDGSSEDWGNNFDAITSPKALFFKGIYEEYQADLDHPVRDFVEKTNRTKLPIKIGGHSQGKTHGEIANFSIRSIWQSADVESIGFAGPETFTPKGIAAAKDIGMRATHLRRPGDIVWKVGPIIIDTKRFKISWGKHYGKQINLPRPAGDHSVIVSHSWLHYMESLKLWMKWAGKPRQCRIIDEIKHVCKM